MCLIAINQTFSSGAYIFHKRDTLSLPARHNQSSLFLSSCSLFVPVPNLCAHRDRKSKPPEPDALHRDTCSGVRAIKFLGASSATARRRDRLLPLRQIEIVFVFFQVAPSGRLHLLPGGRSWDCTREHLPASTVVRYFMQHTMSTSVNGAAGAFGTGPSSGYNLKRLFFVFSMSPVVVVVLAMFISNLSSDKITHVHIYATTILCVIF